MEERKLTKEKEACFSPNKEKPCSDPCTCKTFHSFDGAKLIAKSTRILQSTPLKFADKQILAKKQSVIICKIDADETGRKPSIQCLKYDGPQQTDCKTETKQSVKKIDCNPKTQIDCKQQETSQSCVNQKGESVNQPKQSILSLTTVHKIDLDPCEFQKGDPQSFLQISTIPHQNAPFQQAKKCCEQKTLKHQPKKGCCNQQIQSCNQISSVNALRNRYNQQQNYCNQALNKQRQRACHQQRQFNNTSAKGCCNQQFHKASINQNQSYCSQIKSGHEILNELCRKRCIQKMHNQQRLSNQFSFDPCQQSKYIEQQNPCNQVLNNKNQQRQKTCNSDPLEGNIKIRTQQQQTSNEIFVTPWVFHNKKTSLQSNPDQALVDGSQKLRNQLQQLCNQISNDNHRGSIGSKKQWSPWIYPSKTENPINTPQSCHNQQHELLNQQLMEALIKLRQIHDHHQQIQQQLQSFAKVNKSSCCCKQSSIQSRQSCSNKQQVDQYFCNQQQQAAENLVSIGLPRQLYNLQNPSFIKPTNKCCCNEQNQSKFSNDRPQQRCCNQSVNKIDPIRNCSCNLHNQSMNGNSIQGHQPCCFNEENQPSIKISIDPQSNCCHQKIQSTNEANQCKTNINQQLLDSISPVSNELPLQSCIDFMKNAMNNPNMALAIFKKITQDIQNNSQITSNSPSNQQPVNVTTETICMTVKKPQSPDEFPKTVSAQNDGKQIIQENCKPKKTSEGNLLAGYCTDEYVEFETEWIIPSVDVAPKPQTASKSSHHPKTPIYKTNINTEFLEKDVRKTVKCSAAQSCVEKGFPYRRHLLEAKGLIPKGSEEKLNKEDTEPIPLNPPEQAVN